MTEGEAQTLFETGGDPLVSVVLPVYNGEKYLAEAIESILAQTFENFELIMIDDGSTDNSQQILREYEKSDSRVRVIVRENRGLATTLNDSIDLARGEWLARMDQDDIALPQRFERQLEWLKETGADISGSWVRRFGSSDKRIVRLRQTDEAIKMEMLFCSPFAHPSVMMRTELVKLLRYDIAWEKAEDYDLWERAAKAGWKMTNVQEVLLLYRLHESQISTVTSIKQRHLTQQIQRKCWIAVFEAMQFDSRDVDKVLEIYGPSGSTIDMNVVDVALINLLKRNDGEAREVILSHALRLYYRVAADCPDIVTRWVRLNREIGRSPAFLTWFKLWILNNFKIYPENELFVFLRKLHIFLIRKM